MALVFKRLIIALVLAFCAVAVIATRPAPAADVAVILDQAKLIKLPEKAVTVVIGNPLIADASLQAGGLVVITGKSYGMTNFIALDRAGAVLMDKSIEVQGPREHMVVVHRGILRPLIRGHSVRIGRRHRIGHGAHRPQQEDQRRGRLHDVGHGHPVGLVLEHRHARRKTDQSGIDCVPHEALHRGVWARRASGLSSHRQRDRQQKPQASPYQSLLSPVHLTTPLCS